jgi:hypothetical protein
LRSQLLTSLLTKFGPQIDHVQVKPFKFAQTLLCYYLETTIKTIKYFAICKAVRPSTYFNSAVKMSVLCEKPTCTVSFFGLRFHPASSNWKSSYSVEPVERVTASKMLRL